MDEIVFRYTLLLMKVADVQKKVEENYIATGCTRYSGIEKILFIYINLLIIGKIILSPLYQLIQSVKKSLH